MELTFNEILELWMKRNKVTKEAFGDKLGISRPTVYVRLETGGWRPDEIEKMEKMGIDIGVLKKERKAIK